MTINYYTDGGKRAGVLEKAMINGSRLAGYRCGAIPKERYTGVKTRIAALYGLWGNSRDIIHEYVDAGKKSIFFDLGYWGRHDGGRLKGYHRIAIDGYHAKFDNTDCSPVRFNKFKIKTKSFDNSGEYILLCGQSAKAAWVYNLSPEEWEKQTIEEIRKYTDRPIWYVPKPSWLDKKPISGTIYCDGPVEQYLGDCKAVVTHHSNSGVHALALGKPVFTQEGISKSLVGELDLSKIESPMIPSEEERDMFLFNVAQWQWSVDEISGGIMLRCLKSRGLL